LDEGGVRISEGNVVATSFAHAANWIIDIAYLVLVLLVHINNMHDLFV
jgi:hypothetical protein